jgi:selenocysteine-specific elongation factor
VNLAGLSHAAVMRGQALVRRHQWAPTRTVDCSLTVLASLDHDVSRRGAYQAYIGSGEHAVRVRVLGVEALSPGGHGFVRLHLPTPLPLLPGDRFVLREAGRGETVGGGEVLDVTPVLAAARAAPSRSVDRVVAEREWVDVDELERLTGERRTPTVGSWVVDPGALSTARAEVEELVAGAGELGLDVAALSERQRAVLSLLDDVVVGGGRARPAAAGDALQDHPLVAALAAAPFSPPALDSVDRAQLRELVRRGLVVERDGCYFAASAIEAAARQVATLLAATPDGVTVATVRDALRTTRKHVLPLLAHLDATGVTRRRGDVRIAGPRLPNP